MMKLISLQLCVITVCFPFIVWTARDLIIPNDMIILSLKSHIFVITSHESTVLPNLNWTS